MTAASTMPLPHVSCDRTLMTFAAQFALLLIRLLAAHALAAAALVIIGGVGCEPFDGVAAHRSAAGVERRLVVRCVRRLSRQREHRLRARQQQTLPHHRVEDANERRPKSLRVLKCKQRGGRRGGRNLRLQNERFLSRVQTPLLLRRSARRPPRSPATRARIVVARRQVARAKRERQKRLDSIRLSRAQVARCGHSR